MTDPICLKLIPLIDPMDTTTGIIISSRYFKSTMETSKLSYCLGLWTSILTLSLIMAMVTREFSAVTFKENLVQSPLTVMV